MIDYANKTALVTGASSGIGRAVAIELARRGARVVLAARSADRLEALAAQIRSAHGVDAWPLAVDLSVEAGPDRAFDAVRKMDLDVDVLVNNAGFGSFGFFESLPLDREHREIMLNVVALARLTHLTVPGMLARGSGIIMNVASTAAFQPLPYMATYAATKAFVLSFTEALWAEYRNRGIRVLAVCPGATDTDFFNIVGTEQAAGGKKRPVEGVVRGAFRALERNKTCFIDGGRNWFQAHLIRIAPRKAVVSGAAAVMYPKE
ncbi:MAG TPA: SDR family oxidoreductase [Spirochaetia bacterium]|nr:SDR family oxidoreductase [Spirochaetia bacterium]